MLYPKNVGHFEYSNSLGYWSTQYLHADWTGTSSSRVRACRLQVVIALIYMHI